MLFIYFQTHIYRYSGPALQDPCLRNHQTGVCCYSDIFGYNLKTYIIEDPFVVIALNFTAVIHGPLKEVRFDTLLKIFKKFLKLSFL